MQHNPHPYPPQRARVPLGLILSVALVAMLIVAGIIAIFWREWLVFSTAYPNVADLLRFVAFAAPVSLGVGYAYMGMLILWRRFGEREQIRADKVIGLAKAQRAFPDNLQSLSFHDSHKAQVAPPVVEETQRALPAPSVPSFAQLLNDGQIGPGRQLILGYDAASSAPITGSWNDLYSCGIGGMTGSGKSWAIAFLAGQSAAAGARIILIDPHAGDPESLSNRIAGLSPSYMCDVASEPRDIESALKLASSKLYARRAGRGGSWPILLIVDEWTSLLRGKLGDLLTATALDFAEQGRKFGCFAMLGAQAWQVDAAGAVRDRLASHYVLRTRGDQFRYQTGLRASVAPEDTLTLQAGQAYLLSVRGDLTKIQIPTMTQADIMRLGTLIDKPAGSTGSAFGFSLPPTQPLTPITASAETSRKHSGNIAETSPAHVSTAAQSPEAVRALALLHEGRDLPAIVKELRGVTPRSARSYMAALAEVTDLLRQATKPEGGAR